MRSRRFTLASSFFVPSRSGAVYVLRRAGLESFDEAEVDKALARRR